jgi:hypothetical protein
VSQLFSVSESENIIKLIATFIRLACRPLREKKSMPKMSKMACRALDLNVNSAKGSGGDMRCSFEKMSWETIDLASCVNFKTDKEIFLFRHLGGGANGGCCLALTKNGGQCCAVKFFLDQDGPSRLKLAQNELVNWNAVYGHDTQLPKCHVGNLPNSDGYLCMPYLRPISKSERQTCINNGKVKDALNRFAVSGYKHNDVCWRHLGWWQEKLYLLDLGDISECEEQDRQAWVNQACSLLEGRANTELGV